MIVLTSQNMKKAEQYANNNGLSYYAMMDMAGTKCAEAISKEDKTGRVVILCGKGRNGGDGLVIASRLWEHGFKKITVVLIHGDITDELCFKMFVNLKKLPVNIIYGDKNQLGCLHQVEKANILIDCIFGIGFKGELSGIDADIVQTANYNINAVKYAVDIPSGLTADGEYHGQLYFKTDKTLSIIAYKPVHVKKPTADFCGKTSVMHIGIESSEIEQFAESYRCFSQNEIKPLIRKRIFDDNKGNFGKVLLIAGSRNMTGCVYLSAQAAVETGAGLVTAAFPDCIYNAVTPKLNEPVMLPLSYNANGRIQSSASVALSEKMKSTTVIAFGCGIGVDEDTIQLTQSLIKTAKCPLIIDADGINCLAENINVLKEAKAEIILTPHPGEMARLTGKTIDEIQSDRITVAKEFAKEYGVTLVLKGANTVIASPDGKIYLNTTGNPGMARGGSGDVLTGVIAGLIPQTDSVFIAACVGAYIHGGAADLVVAESGVFSATPSRVINHLPMFLSQFTVKE